jgi:hypothetical protein
MLEALREGLRRLKLVRRRARTLYATPRGRTVAADPGGLLRLLAGDLGRGDPFTESIAATITDSLAAEGPCKRDTLVAFALRELDTGGWHDPEGRTPTDQDISPVVADIICRGEGYGVIQRSPDASRSRYGHSLVALTDAARAALGRGCEGLPGETVLVFDADLLNVRGVGASVAVGAHQHLTSLHDAIQTAFGWHDDHLYSFWLRGGFWGDRDSEYTTPDAPDEAPQTADVPVAELDLAIGAEIAYIFDFGEEWRVQLTLRRRVEPDGGVYPRVLAREGTPPPRHPSEPED